MLRTITVAMALSLAAAGASAADPDLNDQVQTYQGAQFMCTGISEEARNNPALDAYALKLQFSTVEGDFVANVQTTVRDASGAVVLQADCFSPWLLADLGPGEYRVSATAETGETREATVSVQSGKQVSQVIQFPSVKDT